MRRSLLALLLFASIPLFAQDRSNRVSVFFTDPGLGYSEGSGWDEFISGVGVAYEKRFGARWSVELAAERAERTERTTFIDFEGHIIQGPVELQTTSVDLTGRYHISITRSVRWRPYVGGGVRWVQAPGLPAIGFEDRVSPEVIVGLDYNMNPAWTLRIDMKRLLGNGAVHDPVLKVALGAGYRF